MDFTYGETFDFDVSTTEYLISNDTDQYVKETQGNTPKTSVTTEMPCHIHMNFTFVETCDFDRAPFQHHLARQRRGWICHCLRRDHLDVSTFNGRL